jgi:hypothetical protein
MSRLVCTVRSNAAVAQAAAVARCRYERNVTRVRAQTMALDIAPALCGRGCRGDRGLPRIRTDHVLGADNVARCIIAVANEAIAGVIARTASTTRLPINRDQACAELPFARLPTFGCSLRRPLRHCGARVTLLRVKVPVKRLVSRQRRRWRNRNSRWSRGWHRRRQRRRHLRRRWDWQRRRGRNW